MPEEKPNIRDPRIDPQTGDVLLLPDGAVIVGDRSIIDGDEVMIGCGDHRYWFVPIDRWRKEYAEAKVLHVQEKQ